MQEINIRVSGEAGQGMKTIGMALCGIFKKAGLNIFAHQDYMSRIRGGDNFFQIRVSSYPVGAPREKIDIFIPLNKESVFKHLDDMSDEGTVFIDPQEYSIDDPVKNSFEIDMFGMAKRAGGSDIYVNSVSLGAISALIGIEKDHVEKEVSEIFADKDER